MSTCCVSCVGGTALSHRVVSVHCDLLLLLVVVLLFLLLFLDEGVVTIFCKRIAVQVVAVLARK